MTDCRDIVINLLYKSGWDSIGFLAVKDQPDKPVYIKKVHNKVYKVVVGPLWTTYYDIKGEIIGQMDSIKTEDYDAIKEKIEELTNKK